MCSAGMQHIRLFLDGCANNNRSTLIGLAYFFLTLFCSDIKSVRLFCQFVLPYCLSNYLFFSLLQLYIYNADLIATVLGLVYLLCRFCIFYTICMSQAITITKSKLIITPIPSEVSKKRLNDNRGKNLIRTSNYNGYLSRRTKVKLERIIEGVIDGLQLHKKYNKKLHFVDNRQATFVTLTLSYKQFHSDNLIKRKLLTPFLQYAVKSWGVVNYVWRAEPQKNGNIHFHLLFDRFVDWMLIRDKWNALQNRLEYIDAFEQKHGHRNPNSTDVHALRKVKNVAAYICKYMSKEDSCRKIEGRLWGCSSLLHKVKNPRIELDSAMNDELCQLRDEGFIYQKVFDYVSILKVKLLDLLSIPNSILSNIYEQFVYLNFTSNYICNGT